MAAQRRIELRIEYGVYMDGSQRPSLDQSLDALPRRRHVRAMIQRELRDAYGCEYSISGREIPVGS